MKRANLRCIVGAWLIVGCGEDGGAPPGPADAPADTAAEVSDDAPLAPPDAVAGEDASKTPPDASVSDDLPSLDADATPLDVTRPDAPAPDAPAPDAPAPDAPSSPTRAFDGAEGFGANAAGGRGGTVYTVTNLNDSGTGSLRWAVERSGRRIVQFAVDGVIQLRSALDIRDPFVTIDGRGALDPGERGITLRDYPINVRTNDVIIRYLRVRLGDYAVLRRVAMSGLSRPANSNDLDCINIDNARNVIVDHVSASWSTDEIVSVTNSRNVTVQWSILSEPISNPRAHPYGDNHAFCANNSASTLTYHHNLFAHFVFRGPQFEANDAASWRPPSNPSFEAVNNVVYAYTSSGSRFRFGFERASDRNTQVQFLYHFVGNRYVNASRGDSEINAAVDFGVERNVRSWFSDNVGPHRAAGATDQLSLVFTDNNASNPLRSNAAALRQVATAPLFTSTVPVTVQRADDAMRVVLDTAGCNLGRDAIDQRIVADVRAVRPAAIVTSQANVPGGWPTYR